MVNDKRKTTNDKNDKRLRLVFKLPVGGNLYSS